jgi:hypothetical protein
MSNVFSFRSRQLRDRRGRTSERDDRRDEGTAEDAQEIIAAVWDLPVDSHGLAFGLIGEALADRDRAAFVMMRLAQFAAASIAELAQTRDLDPLMVLRVLTECNQRPDLVDT